MNNLFIFSNLATSIDGKIAPAKRGHVPFGTPYDRKKMQIIRKKSDAIIMGASSLRAYKKPLIIKNQKKQPVNIIVSSRLDDISPNWEFFQEKKTTRILFVKALPSNKRLSLFKKNSEVIQIKKTTSASPLAKQIVAHLKKIGIKTLLVEGGGQLIWEFVSAKLLDELNVTLTPLLVGGAHAPTLMDGHGFTAKSILKLKLKKVEKIGHELYLVYTK